MKNAAADPPAAGCNKNALAKERNAMISIDIAGFKELSLRYLVLDYNGTLACDGRLLPDVAGHITRLARELDIHVLTADTHKTCALQLVGLPVTLSVVPARPEDAAKLDYVRSLGLEQCVCIGNGMNDRFMLKACGLGIAVLGGEGSAAQACLAADIIAPGIIEALELLEHPLRILATLRN
jgi:soluble P-type ATPase